MRLSMFSPSGVEWQNTHEELDSFEVVCVQNPLGKTSNLFYSLI